MYIKMSLLKNMSSEEVFKLIQFRESIFVVEQECAYQESDEFDIIAIHFWCCDKNNNIVCCARVIPVNRYNDYISIGRVAVKKDKRKHGLASELLRTIMVYIENNLNYNLEKEIRLSAQVYAKSLYEKIGFSCCSDEYFLDGIPHIDMKYN